MERGKTPCPSHKYVCSPSPGSQQNTSSLHLAATTTVRFWNPTCPLSLNAYQLASVPSRQIICLDSKKLNKCTPDTTLGTGEVKIRKEGPNLKQFPLGTTKSKGLMLILLSSTLGSPTGPILNLPGPGPAGAHPRAFSQHFSSPCCGHQLLPPSLLPASWPLPGSSWFWTSPLHTRVSSPGPTDELHRGSESHKIVCKVLYTSIFSGMRNLFASYC